MYCHLRTEIFFCSLWLPLHLEWYLVCSWCSVNICLKNSESEVPQSCPTLCDLMDCSLPGSSVHRIFQARVLEWVAISFSRRSSRPRDWTQISHIVGRRFTTWAIREALNICFDEYKWPGFFNAFERWANFQINLHTFYITGWAWNDFSTWFDFLQALEKSQALKCKGKPTL